MCTEQQLGDLSDLIQGLFPDAEARNFLQRVAVNIKDPLDSWELGYTIAKCAEHGIDINPFGPKGGRLELAWDSGWLHVSAESDLEDQPSASSRLRDWHYRPGPQWYAWPLFSIIILRQRPAGGQMRLPQTVCLRGASQMGQVCGQLLPRTHSVGLYLCDIDCTRTAHISIGDPTRSLGEYYSHP